MTRASSESNSLILSAMATKSYRRNGGMGLTMAMTHSEIDLFIVDINMPNMNGLEMIEEIRLIGAHQKTPIFVLTTESSSEIANEGKQAGATAWIVKPFKEEPLLAGIRHVLTSLRRLLSLPSINP